MKREQIKRYDTLYSFFPLFFWYTCHKCKQEFRREKGWRGLGLPIRDSQWTTYYLCNGCAPTRAAADLYFLTENYLGDFRGNRPITRPPAPITKKD